MMTIIQLKKLIPYYWKDVEGDQLGILDFAWNNSVSLKVSLFAWRVLSNRIPTKDNLFRCRIFPHNSCLCLNDYSVEKSLY
jgi:hypothetical protein